MRGKIALEEHVSTPENNRLWDSSGEAGRNGTEYMKDVERRLLDRSIQLEEMAQRHIDHVILSLTSPGASLRRGAVRECEDGFPQPGRHMIDRRDVAGRRFPEAASDSRSRDRISRIRGR